MRTATKLCGALTLLAATGVAFAAGGDLGQTVKQETNWTAIIMFLIFVGLTLWITKRVATSSCVSR